MVFGAFWRHLPPTLARFGAVWRRLNAGLRFAGTFNFFSMRWGGEIFRKLLREDAGALG